MEGLSAEVAAKLFLRHCVALFGVPNEILTDNDHLICSQFFSTLVDLLGIEQHVAIVYRPKGNGRAEAAVKSVVNILRRTLEGERKNWVQVLPWALFQLNDLPGFIAPHSPHKIVFGRDPVAIGDIPSQTKFEKAKVVNNCSHLYKLFVCQFAKR